ncbi:TIGR02452 family protein [Psychrobacter sp. I-STPA10]|uniref:TIGR02452 family protein n=1 Tax=Psychrobacter sp. I-STPA10 TaxID=2585769 RepID=UPI001E490BA5|nr:TIGR02452 family protein [Psychrobacter sp. I-STPA10]
MSLKGIAKQTLEISQTGQLPCADGSFIDFSIEQRYAEAHTELFRPDELQALLNQDSSANTSERTNLPNTPTKIEVTTESTQQATYRLVVDEKIDDVVLLNFASARNAGGGFINGAKAQEEDLCRCSGLYLCQLTQPDYYEINRKQSSLLYTDHIIYSPKVPFFRLNIRELLPNYFLASVITAPAPNAGQHLRQQPNDWTSIKQTLRQRTGYVLAVAKAQGHKTLVLGAWGCGVFRNNPNMVAEVFADWLKQPQFASVFNRVVFAIYDKSQSQATYQAFANQFSA